MRRPRRPHVHTWHEAGRFVLVGIVNTMNYYVTFLVLQRLTWYLFAHVVAFVVSMIASFFLNCWFTYRVRPTLRKALLFPATNAVNFAVTTAGIAALVEGAHLDPRIAAIAAAVVAVPFTFLLSRRILKRGDGQRPAPTDHPADGLVGSTSAP